MGSYRWAVHLILIPISISGIRKGYRNPELFSILDRDSVRHKLARVPVTFKDRSFSKPMRRDAGDRKIPRSPWPMPWLVYPLSADRFQDRDTDNADDRCRTIRGQKIVDDSATVSNIPTSHLLRRIQSRPWQRSCRLNPSRDCSHVEENVLANCFQDVCEILLQLA